MAINGNDGRFGLDCYLKRPLGNEDPDDIVYSDTISELKQQALLLMRGGRYEFLLLERWDADQTAWVTIDEYDIDDYR